jgi:CBS domain-containing protein
MFVADILRMKGPDVVHVRDDAPVTDALRLLTEHRIGAVLVGDGSGRIVGILSERDVTRALHQRGPSLVELPVSALMTRDVYACSPGDDVCDVLATMTSRRFRHMPVMEDGRLAGMISIGDVVKARIDETEAEAAALREYIGQ